MTSALLRPEVLADMFGVSRDYVMTRARSHDWPHLRVGRSVRFTEEHVAQIVGMTTVAPSAEKQHADDWGQKTRKSA